MLSKTSFYPSLPMELTLISTSSPWT